MALSAGSRGTSPLSDTAPAPRLTGPLALGAYLLSGLLIAWYLVTMWLMLHPVVSADYRAYYIDQTTTCMNQPVPGDYAFGTMVSFLPDGRDQQKPIKVCGWEGPVGDGMHAVGTSARLRFNPTERPASMALVLQMIAIKRDGVPTQTVSVSLNGTKLADLDVDGGAPSIFKLPIPADIATKPGPIELLLDFPTAVQMGPTDPRTRWRSIKLQSVGLVAN